MEFPVFEHAHGYILEYLQVSRMFVKNAGPNFEDDGLIGWIVGKSEEDVNTLVNTIWYHRKYVMKEDVDFYDLRLEVVGHWEELVV